MFDWRATFSVLGKNRFWFYSFQFSRQLVPRSRCSSVKCSIRHFPVRQWHDIVSATGVPQWGPGWSGSDWLWCSLATVHVMPCGRENTAYTRLVHQLLLITFSRRNKLLRRNKKEAIQLFVDFARACDTVWKRGTWNWCQNIGCVRKKRKLYIYANIAEIYYGSLG